MKNAASLHSQRKLNSFIYDACVDADVAFPTLPVFLVEQYAQCAEDVIVASLLRAWVLRRGVELSSQRYLEIGGNHPISTSATLLLSRLFGMHGVIVEANPDLLDTLKKVRAHDRIVHAAITDQDVPTIKLSISNADELSSVDRGFVLDWRQGSVGERAYIDVPALRINTLIEQELDGVAPIFLSVDIEGHDLAVLKDLDFTRYRPFIVQAEPSDHYIPQNSSQMAEFMASVGYLPVASTEVNMIFIDTLPDADAIPRDQR